MKDIKYKYKVNDTVWRYVSEDESGEKNYGVIDSLSIGDDGISPTYKIKNKKIKDANLGNWWERYIGGLVAEEQSHMLYKYQVGDIVFRKGNPDITGTIRKKVKTDNGKYPAYKIKKFYGGTSKWSESRIEKVKVTTDIETSTKPVNFNDINIGDSIVIKSKEEFEKEGFTFDSIGNPRVKTVWDSNKKMQKYFGKTIKVTFKKKNTISANSWVWSIDAISKVIPLNISADTTTVDPETTSDTTNKPESESKPAPKPEPEFEPEPVESVEPEVVYKKLKIEDEIKLMMPTPILLEGPVGSGKSSILMKIAKDLNLRYFASVMSDATTASEFKGYKNVVDGTYVSSEFRDAYENGGMFVLEELNATTSNMPIIFNSLENGYFVFADKLIYGHKDFRLCATMNTITNAADFGGRRPLDKSVKSRFYTIIMKTQWTKRFDKKIATLVTALSKAFKNIGHSAEIDPRDVSKYLKLVELGIDPKEAIYKTFDINRVLSSTTVYNILNT